MDRAHHLGEPVRIAPATAGDAGEWLELRLALWPGDRREEFATEIAALLADPGDTITLIAHADTGETIGFAEAELRHDYVEGCKTSPVAFLEGIYVAPDHRRKGVAAALVRAVEGWGRQKGCTEFASDARIDNLGSHAMHLAIGFTETVRVVYFRKEIS